LDAIVVVLVVCLAVGYLVWRYVIRGKDSGGCACESTECPLKNPGSLPVEKPCAGMACESKEDEP
jgi:hypothetical protein